jgi:hypothetical protein
MRSIGLALCLAASSAFLSACGGGDDGPGPAAGTATLSLSRSGTGSGAVTSTPAGIDCGLDCSETLAAGTPVTLHATADVGSVFTGWSGGGCSGTGDCAFDLVGDATTDAAFALAVSLSCTSITNAVSCTNGAIGEINLGPITATECRAQCEIELPAAGVTAGCWILASNLNCYCRSGSLNLGGTRPGGSCS